MKLFRVPRNVLAIGVLVPLMAGPSARAGEGLAGACCSEDGTCTVMPADVCADNSRNFLGANTGCNPNPCPQPVGACCSSEQCSQTTIAQCPDLYLGDGSPCDADICNSIQFGACCLGHVGCVPLPEGACFAGDFGGVGSDCSSCTPNNGACCTSFAGCLENALGFPMDETTCRVVGGTFLGSGSDCSNVLVGPCAKGACCVNSGGLSFCAETFPGLDAFTKGTCEQFRGTFLGAGSTCSSPENQVCPIGACCLGTGQCADTAQGLNPGLYGGVTESACTLMGGGFAGAGTSCSPNTCTNVPPSTGACCVSGLCAEGTIMGNPVTRDFCEIIGGSFVGEGSTCMGPENQLCPTSLCCLPDGTCADSVTDLQNSPQDARITREFCESFGGTSLGSGHSCTEGVCTGSCCFSDSSCAETDRPDCIASGANFLGFNTNCLVNPCPVFEGACCLPGVCQVKEHFACSLAGGDYQGDGTSCDSGACSAPSGACCMPDGSCDVRDSFSCTVGVQGQFQGSGTSCSPNFCLQPLGACCVPTGGCQVIHADDCNALGVTYFGDGTTCDSNPCPEPTGACCGPNGQCFEVTADFCVREGGQFINVGVLCDPSPCQTRHIALSNPAHCMIDARTPFPANQPSNRKGIQTIEFAFDGTAGFAEDDPGDYEVIQFPATPPPPPTISSVTTLGNFATIHLSEPIRPGKWTCIRHNASEARRCMGYLPGDASSNGRTSPSDILDLIDNLNGVRIPPLQIHQCDINRSNQCTPADLISEIDLLNGTNGFSVANGAQLEMCPFIQP